MSKNAARYSKVQPSRRDVIEALNADELYVEGALVRHFIANYGHGELVNLAGDGSGADLGYVDQYDGIILPWDEV